MRRFALLMLAAFALSLAAAGSALGCVCVFSPKALTPEEARAALVKDFNGAFAVFTGEVVARDTFKVKFKVERIWKGGFGDEITMQTGAVDNGNGTYSVSSCDYDFSPGEKYLVYAYGDSAGEIKARACTRTRELKHAGQEVKDLDGVWPHEKRNEKPDGEKRGRAPGASPRRREAR